MMGSQQAILQIYLTSLVFKVKQSLPKKMTSAGSTKIISQVHLLKEIREIKKVYCLLLEGELQVKLLINQVLQLVQFSSTAKSMSKKRLN